MRAQRDTQRQLFATASNLQIELNEAEERKLTLLAWGKQAHCFLLSSLGQIMCH